MKYKQNLHIHSNYCDGVDTPEQMVEAAIQKGFDSIGFSGHSYMSYAPEHSMSLVGTEEYIKHINMLKDKFCDRIKIFCGIEYDMYSDIDISAFDYAIGSIHYFDIDGEKVGFDRSEQEVKRIIDTYFGGDGMKYAKRYYEALANLSAYGKFDIIGHIDLITKHSENIQFFDESSKEYQTYVIEALEALEGKIPFFEVNTGAIARGYRKTPYPAPFLIKELKRLGFRAVISSDCHDSRMLDCSYTDAEQLLKQNGFNEIYVLKENGFEPILV